MMGGVTEVPGDAPARIEGQEFECPRAVATNAIIFRISLLDAR